MDAVTVLARESGELRALAAAVRSQPGIGDGATGRQLRRRQELIDELRRCFVTHERAKQRYLWPALRRTWPDGAAIADAARRRGRHIEEHFIKYRWLSARDVRVDEVVAEILGGIEEHVSSEHHLLGRIHRGLDLRDREEIGAKLTARRLLVPTRPHPDMPSAPWAAAALGPVLGLADRLVEAFSFGPTGA
ncbi:MAG: hemerythrin domain-containing protein [Streptosporangiaceae bacterium]